MSERLQVYRCTACGSMSAVLRGGAGTLACCGIPMTIHQDTQLETHLVGEVPPMEHNLTLSAKAIIRLLQTRVADHTSYFGIQTLKNPLDFWVYQELIWELKPDVIVEIGNAYGGSALALAHLLDRIGKGIVLAVDIQHDTFTGTARAHPRIQLITSDACAAIDTVRASIQEGDTVLIIEDSAHTYDNTINVLNAYAPLVSPGSYFIIEDSHCWHGLDYGPIPGAYEAIADFLANHPEFISDRARESFFLTFNPTGFLKRIP
ncbi:MAG: desulfoferrodoxin FeS4 iron-binding domain-containing protein [Candidatus Hydrogenedentes bacterium]|nr:desulfoferrodoxin FeS4 iron-binding domain-containing protein [Candidatus Hydrogenedentota bacterium]